MMRMEASFIPQSNLGIMDEEEEEEEEHVELGFLSSFSEEDEEGSSNSIGSSSSSDLTEDATSSTSSSSNGHLQEGALFKMSSLIAQLPFKRGLSKHFEGKSQSFTSLSSVLSLEDLAKPERPPYRKKLKSSKSCGGGLDGHKPLSPKGCSKTIAKKSSKRPSILGSRPPITRPQRSAAAGGSGQTLLFA